MSKEKLQLVSTGAVFSPCRTWRYQLHRCWNPLAPKLNVIGLNPSTADETQDDPTIRRCISFARDWGYGSLYMTNIFGYRATDPKVMKAFPEPIGPENNEWLVTTSKECDKSIAAWGTHGNFLNRHKDILELLDDLYVFRLTKKTGVPEHPLYLPGNLIPVKLDEAVKIWKTQIDR